MRSQHRRRLIGATLGIWVLMAQTGMVSADSRYSGVTFEAWYDPIGAEPVTDYCARSGIVHEYRNYGQILAYTNGGGAHDCAGSGNTMPAGWLGVMVEGYRSGAFCGQSDSYVNSSAATNWQLWDTTCTNPSGSQNFYTISLIFPYDGDSYHTHVGPQSPAHAF